MMLGSELKHVLHGAGMMNFPGAGTVMPPPQGKGMGMKGLGVKKESGVSKTSKATKKSKKAEEEAEGGKKRRRRKAKRDPTQPKRPQTGYLLFLVRERSKIMAGDPAVSIPEATRAIAQRWREMSDGDKSEYHKEAEADRQRYQREMAEWQPKAQAAAAADAHEAERALYDDDGKKKRGRRPRPKAPEGQPKRARSAYIEFLCNKRDTFAQQHPDMSFPEVTKHLASEWRSMDDVARAPFKELGERNRLAYSAAKKDWDATVARRAHERLERYAVQR